MVLDSTDVKAPPSAAAPAKNSPYVTPPTGSRLETDAPQESEPELPEPERRKPAQRVLARYEAFIIPGLILFVLGNAAAYLRPEAPVLQISIAAPLLLILLGLVIASQKYRVVRGSLWLALLLMGGLYYQQLHFTPGTNDISHLAPQDGVRLSGVLVSRKGNQSIVEVQKADGQAVSGKVLVYEPEQVLKAPVGSVVLVDGDLKQPFHNPVPGNFDQREYLRAQAITAVMRNIGDIHENTLAPRPWKGQVLGWIDGLKQRVSDTFSAVLPSPHAEVLGGIVLGDKAIPVDRETRRQFVQTGLVHVLAASGLNVGIIAGFLFWVLGFLQLPFRVRMGVSMIGVAFYALLTGMPPSIQRAATMLELALFLKLLNRELSPLFLLCIAATVLVLVFPDNIASIGFQFSVLTTFGLITMVPPLQDRLGHYITRWLAGLILVPLVAQLWIWPLSVAYFNDLPVHSVLLNIGAIALVAPLTAIGFTAGLAAFLWQPLGELITWLSWPFVQGLLWLVNFGDQMSWAKWRFASPPGWLIGLAYMQLLMSLALLYKLKDCTFVRKALLFGMPLMLMLGVMAAEKWQSQTQTRLEILPLSYRQSAFLIRPAHSDQHLLLMPETTTYWEGRTVAGYLKHHNVQTLTGVFLLPSIGQDTDDTAGFKAALKDIDVKNLLAVSSGNRSARTPQLMGQALPSAQNLHAGQSAVLSTLTLINGSAVAVTTPAGCLLALTSKYRADLPCAVQHVQGEDSRLYAEKLLKPGTFYRLSVDGHQVRVD